MSAVDLTPGVCFWLHSLPHPLSLSLSPSILSRGELDFSVCERRPPQKTRSSFSSFLRFGSSLLFLLCCVNQSVLTLEAVNVRQSEEIKAKEKKERGKFEKKESQWNLRRDGNYLWRSIVASQLPLIRIGPRIIEQGPRGHFFNRRKEESWKRSCHSYISNQSW